MSLEKKWVPPRLLCLSSVNLHRQNPLFSLSSRDGRTDAVTPYRLSPRTSGNRSGNGCLRNSVVYQSVKRNI
ncbi:hypothetical protein E2C01_029909 [Portunus trituberculatus]|uniref:Uncharacterized protein n=1 Tax=Portunus trituberculatus TaxID=210409 RepID=A0A5B7EPJ6_PORTR|nr:hypothetical protein [Portunus trituberculatus]